MGKTKKKLDFQKTKLRVGRIVKRPNDTNTNFKSKKIVLTEQMKHYVGLVNEKHESDINDHLKALSQINSLRKVAALKKIQELSRSKSPQIDSNVSEIVRKVCAKVHDPDGNVRKTTLDIIPSIFSCVGETKLIPLFPVLRTLLTCASTNIDRGVRKDSLRFVDIIMSALPRALANSTSVLNNFLNQISYQATKATSKKKNRMLFATPMDEITAQEWRMSVLSCLTRYLDTINNFSDDDNQKPEIPEFDFDRNKHFMAFVKHFEFTPDMSFSINKSQVLQNDKLTHFEVQKFYEQLLPLVSDIWKEAVPRANMYSSEMKDTLPFEAYEIVETIINLIYQLTKWMSKKNFSDKLLQDFKDFYSGFVVDTLMVKFPFSFAGSLIRKQNLLKKMASRLNMAVCEMYACIIPHTKNCFKNHQEYVLIYLSEAINKDMKDLKAITSFLEILKNFLKNEKCYEDCEMLLSSLLNIYIKAEQVEVHKHIADFFLHLVFGINYYSLLSSSLTLQAWMKYTVKELTSMAKSSNIDYSFLNDVRKIAGHNYPYFLESLEENSFYIIEMLLSEDSKIQELATFLITKMNNFSEMDFQNLAAAMRDPKMDLNNILSLLNRLGNKFAVDENANFDLNEYWSFLLEVLIGVSLDNQEIWINEERETLKLMLELHVLNISSFIIFPSKDIARQKQIFKVAFPFLTTFTNRMEAKEHVVNFILKFLDIATHMPDFSVIAILEIWSRFLDSSNQDIVYLIVKLLMSCLSYEFTMMTFPNLFPKLYGYTIDESMGSLFKYCEELDVPRIFTRKFELWMKKNQQDSNILILKDVFDKLVTYNLY